VLARTPPIDDTMITEPSFLAFMSGAQRLISQMLLRMLFCMILVKTSSGILSVGP
jgi:hypothetical protein